MAFAILAAGLPTAALATKRMHERWRAHWRLRQHVPIDTAREGDLVYVTGIAHPIDEALVAPLSGRPCVAYRARASGTAIGPRDYNLGWQQTLEVRPFVVERSDGSRIVVDGDRAIFGVPMTKAPRSAERETSFLARHGIARTKGNLKFNEVFIPVGAHVRVGGTLVLVPREAPPSGELGFRDPPPPDRQIFGSRDLPLVFVSGR